MALLDRRNVNSLEAVIWALFFSLLALFYVMGNSLLENALLIIGICIGLFALYRMSRLTSSYAENAQEIHAWAYRFFVFKVLPVGAALVAAVV
ncbi:hypothetical protein HYU19_01925 [Candidatus Woesearchaeota archaeon]|nr:hypothetical protein [Candidatus Woesearchaeota archaeon]